MSREEALKQLKALRKQLLTVYSCSEICEAEKTKLDALQDERRNPAALDFTPEAIDAEATLRAEFEQKNSRKIRKGWGIEALFLLLCALVLAAVTVGMYLDIATGTSYILSREIVENPGGDQMAALSLQGVFSVVAIIIAIISLVKAKE